MKFNDVPVAMTSQPPYCNECSAALAWPAGTSTHRTTPMLLVCSACQAVVRAQFLVPMQVSRLPAPDSGDSGSNLCNRPVHPTHDYDIVSNACRRCAQLITFHHMGPVNPAWYEPCRGCSTMPDRAMQSTAPR